MGGSGEIGGICPFGFRCLMFWALKRCVIGVLESMKRTTESGVTMP